MDGGGRLLRSVTGLAGQLPGPTLSAAAGGSTARGLSVLPSSRALVRGPAVVRASERVHARIPRFTGTVLLILLALVVGGYGSWRGGQYADLIAYKGEPHNIIARALGFSIETVAISGLVELEQTEVLQVAGIDSRESLPFFDAAAARAKLLAIPLVKEATVRKLYPGSLAITLTEREPFALWQNHGEVFVVAADGMVIDSLNDPRFARLPLVVGDGAAQRATVFSRLMDQVPELKPHVRAGILVGQRRWSLKLMNGMDVHLPEQGAAQALARLAGLIRDNKLLDKDVLAVDLRQSDRVVLRLTEEAASARAEMLKSKPKTGKGSPV